MKEEELKLEILKMQAELCKALADPKRLHIIHVLRDGEKTVGELTESLGFKQSNTSQHLAVMRRLGVVATRKEGSMVYYHLANPKIADACDLVQKVIAEQLRESQLLSSIM